MSNIVKAIAASILSVTTWVETGIITLGWAVCFGILSVCGLLIGADVAAVAHYFAGVMSCGFASALVVSVVHGTVINYRNIIAYERRATRRRQARRARRMA